MGETSAKSMRGGEMEDVIFSGSTTRPARNIAEVVLLLENLDRKVPSHFNDHDELEISRRIERGNGSSYSVNGHDVRARDVQLLFADSATGAHSTALVSQGRVGALINAKPTDRRGAARGGRRHHRPAFAPARGRAAPARRRGQPGAPGRRHRHARKPAAGAEEAGPAGDPLPQPERSHPSRRGDAAASALARVGHAPGGRARGVRRRRDAGGRTHGRSRCSGNPAGRASRPSCRRCARPRPRRPRNCSGSITRGRT